MTIEKDDYDKILELVVKNIELMTQTMEHMTLSFIQQQKELARIKEVVDAYWFSKQPN